MRLLALLVLLVPVCLCPAAVSRALDIAVVEVSGCESFDPDSPAYQSCFGEVITVGLRVENPEQDSITGVSAVAFGYSGVASFWGGSAVAELLHETCIPTIGCFDGMDNLKGGALEEDGSNPLGPFVRFLNYSALSGVSGDGIDSPGLDGLQGGDGAQFRLSFLIDQPGETILNLGIDPAYGAGLIVDGVLQDPPPLIQILLSSEEPPRIVPEPSLTLLVGIGLMGLAGPARRQAHGRARTRY